MHYHTGPMLVLALAFLARPVTAAEIEIQSSPIQTYQTVEIGQRVGDVIWRGGLILTAPEPFGGISGLTFLDDQNLVMVTDRGQFISGRLTRTEQDQPGQLTQTQIEPIRNSRGNPLPANYSRDAEAVETIFREGLPAAVRVGFENLTRVADFDLVLNRPTGPAREIAIPDWISALRTNGSLEAVCIANAASPVAGSTLLINENEVDAEGNHSAWLLGHDDKGPVTVAANSGYNPTDCAFLPDGDLLILERGTGFLSFTMQVRRIQSDELVPNAHLVGDVILNGYGGDIDNMEGLAVRRTLDGRTHIVIVSDDNFNDWERTLLLEFEIPE